MQIDCIQFASVAEKCKYLTFGFFEVGMFEDWGDVAALDSVSVYNWTVVPIVWTYSKCPPMVVRVVLAHVKGL